MTTLQVAQVSFWQGEESRKLALWAPCECGCSPGWYLSGSNPQGGGFTIILSASDAERLGKLDIFKVVK